MTNNILICTAFYPYSLSKQTRLYKNAIAEEKQYNTYIFDKGEVILIRMLFNEACFTSFDSKEDQVRLSETYL